MSHSPFKFLDSYTKEDKDIFFGRETEIEDVYTKVFQSKILLVYGASGTGKSSLISCGLANKFDDTDWLPVNIRRGLNINDSLRNQLEKQVITPLPASKVTLTKILKSVYLDHFKPIFLIFDQFEELFIFGDREEWMTFAENVRQVMSSSLQVRFVFIIRGEYLEYLTDFEETLPEFFNNRIRIEKMTRTKAVNCISGPCHAVGIEVEEHFAENLLTRLSPNKTEIELTYLQVFLDRIYKKANEKLLNGKSVFSNALLEELGNVGDVLSQFLDEQIELIPDSEKALALLKAFVSTDATKKQISLQQAAEFVKTIGKDFGEKQVDRLIQELVNRRILKDKDEAGRYELRHDSIAAKIFEKITSYERDLIEVNQFITYAFGEHEKRNFLLNESDLAYIAPYETKLRLSNKVLEFIAKSKTAVSKKNRSRKRIIATISIISVLFVFSVLALLYANYQKNAADYGFREALKQQNEAIEQKRIAEKQKSIAEEKQQEADKQALIAQQQSAVAFSERQKAIQASQFAEQQRIIALTQKANAEQSQKESDINAQEATKQKVLADAERRKAERLRMIALARSLAAKSTQVEDKNTKGLIALQAWKFNQEFTGYPYQADIYAGLYHAREALVGNDFNVTKVHSSSVKAMVYKEPYLYSAGSDGLIFKSGIGFYKISKSVFAEPGKLINALALSKDGNYLAAGTNEGPIYIYDITTGQKTKELDGHAGGVWAIAFAGQKLVSAGKGNQVLLWDIQASTKIQVANFNTMVNSIGINESEDAIIAGLSNGMIVLLPLTENAKAEVVYEKAGVSVTDLIVGPSQFLMAVGLDNGSIDLTLLPKNDLFKVKREQVNNNVAIGNLMYSENATISISTQKAAITNLAFSPNGRFLFSTAMDGKVLIWDVDEQNEQPILLENHDAWVMSSVVINDGKTLITGDSNGNVRVFPLEAETFHADFCTLLKGNLTEDQWKLYIGDDIPFQNTCTELTQNR